MKYSEVKYRNYIKTKEFASLEDAHRYESSQIANPLTLQEWKKLAESKHRDIFGYLVELDPASRGKFMKFIDTHKLVEIDSSKYTSEYVRIEVRDSYPTATCVNDADDPIIEEESVKWRDGEYRVVFHYDYHYGNPAYNRSVITAYQEILQGPTFTQDMRFTKVRLACCRG